MIAKKHQKVKCSKCIRKVANAKNANCSSKNMPKSGIACIALQLKPAISSHLEGAVNGPVVPL